jgi:hypothetical protein
MRLVCTFTARLIPAGLAVTFDSFAARWYGLNMRVFIDEGGTFVPWTGWGGATILLTNLVAAHDTDRVGRDGRAEILKENKTERNGSSLTETAVTEFRVRCFQPLSHLSTHRAE